MRLPKWGDLRRFCEVQGYTTKPTTDHYRYLKVLPDRTVSRTKVSLGKDAVAVPAILWGRIWREQLRLVSAEEFWRGLDGYWSRVPDDP